MSKGQLREKIVNGIDGSSYEIISEVMDEIERKLEGILNSFKIAGNNDCGVFSKAYDEVSELKEKLY